MKTLNSTLLVLAASVAIAQETGGTRTDTVRPAQSAQLAQPSPGRTAEGSPGYAAAPAAPAMVEGLAVIGNRLYVIRDGQAALQDRTVTMTISADGLIGFDGKQVVIPAGHMVTMSGQIVRMPQGVQGIPLGLPVGTSGATGDGVGARVGAGTPIGTPATVTPAPATPAR